MPEQDNTTFESNINKWLELQNSGDTTGAEEFYYTNLFPKVLAKFKTNSHQFAGKYKYLISLVGMSPQPVMLTIEALQPKEILFLHTKESKHYIDFIVEQTGLRPTQFSWKEVHGSQTEDVYQAIREFLKSKSVKDIAIDITGGKKAMVNGAAEAGGFLGCDVCYVDFGEYLEGRRTPKPGTEYLNFLKNPYEVFGDMEMREAVALYNKGNYAAASQILNTLISRVAEIQKIEILRAVVNFHSLWEEYQFKKAGKEVERALQKIEQYRVLDELRKPLQEKNELLKKLKDNQNFQEYLVLNHYFFSGRYFNRHRYDFAVLLLYRTLELCFSIHLKQKYNIDSSDADYSDYPLLRSQYNNLLPEAFGKKAIKVRELPPKIGFMSSVIILRAFKDPLIENYNLSEITLYSEKRNQGILAHGIRPNTEKDYQSMKNFFKPILDRFVQVYLNKNNIDEYSVLFDPVNLSMI